MKRLPIVLALVLALAGCAEATAEVETPDAFDTVQADPQLIRGAERALAAAPAPEPGWRVGVIVVEAKDRWRIGVLTIDGGMVFLSGRWCEGYPKGTLEEREPYSPNVLSVLLAPGDLITWAGNKVELCPSHVRVLRKAAAQPSPESSP